MHDMLDRLIGLDKKNEIFNLWYEVTYLRFLLVHVLQENPEVGKCITEESIQKARKDAQETVQARFPLCKIEFTEPVKDISEEVTDENKQESP